MRNRLLMLLSSLLLVLVAAGPADAIINGTPDGNDHPYVGQLLFYVPDDVDPRFDDPGSWFNCSGTLLNDTIVLTAGHCTYGTGLNGESTTTTPPPGELVGSGGNDVWVNFSEVPDYSILPPSTTFAPGNNAGRYEAWSTALNASPEWHRATSNPHPDFDPNAFFLHDLGVLELDEGVRAGAGALPQAGLLDRLVKDRTQRYTAVGYGLEGSGQHTAIGGDTRRAAQMQLVNLNGVAGVGKGVAAKFSNNNGKTHTGGTCFGDSGGPIFRSGTNIIVAVTSFGISQTCKDGTGAYRVDQADDLEFLATFGVRPRR
jgi:hypothetical protein